MTGFRPRSLPKAPPNPREGQAPFNSSFDPAFRATSNAGSHEESPVSPNTGYILETSLAADQAWRASRTESRLCGLRRAHVLGLTGRWACVFAACAGSFVGILSVGLLNLNPFEGWAPALWWLQLGLFYVALILFVLGPMLALVGGAWGRWLRMQAQRQVVDLPPPIHTGFPEAPVRQVAESAAARRTAELQYLLDLGEAQGQTARGICLAAGYAAWWSVLLYPHLMNTSAFVKVSVGFALVMGVMVILVSPIAAGIACWLWRRRRGLLKTAEREKLVVRDPARNPWG